MKKKIISILLALTLSLCSVTVLASCDTDGNETEAPTTQATETPTQAPTDDPVKEPTEKPTQTPTEEPTAASTEEPTAAPTEDPTSAPTEEPTSAPTEKPTSAPTEEPTSAPTEKPTSAPTEEPTSVPTEKPTSVPTEEPTEDPTEEPETEAPNIKGCEGDCIFKSVKGKPTCKVCGYIAACYGVHGYTYHIDGHWKPECEHCGKAAGEPQNHEFELVIEDEGDLWLYSFVCSICEFAASEQEVPYEINDFYSAGDFLNKLESSGKLVKSFNCQAGIGFTQYSSESGGSVTVNILKGAEAVFPSGKVLVIKVRLGASQRGFSASVKSANADSSYTMNFSNIGPGWATIIVDLTKACVDGTDKNGKPIVKGFAPDPYDSYYLTDLSITGMAAGGESFDISYVMLCDTMDIANEFVGDDKKYVYSDIVNEDAETDEKICVDENGNPIIHEYIATETGHTLLESCTQCGIVAVTNAPHTFTQMVVDGELTYACSSCKWLQFGANINKYFKAQDIASMAITYYQITNHGVTEEKNSSYVSFSGKGNTGQVIFSRDNDASSALEQAAAFDVGKANLFIIRMKTNTPAIDFGIYFRSVTDGVKESRVSFPLAMTAESEWATYVIDLATVIPKAYVPDENGNFKLGCFYYDIGYKTFTADVKYDIEFMAFVDSWDEVKALVADETVVNVTGSGIGQLVNTADRSCVGGHAFAVVKGENSWALKCDVCGECGRVLDIGLDVDLLMPAEVLKNVKTDSDGKIDLAFMEEDGESFIRLSNLRPNGAGWMGLTFTPAGAGTVTGQYMVMKVRLGENGLGTNYMKMYTGTTIGAKYEGQAASFKMVEDGEWHYVVIDLVACMGDPDTYLVPNEDGTYTVKYLQLRPFAGTQCYYSTDADGNKIYPQRVMEDDYLDIGFIAYCDSLDDLKHAIDADSYEWAVDGKTSYVRNTADNSCVEHTPVVSVEGRVQSVVCSACNKTLRSVTVSEDVNWYSSHDLMDRWTAYVPTLSKKLYDPEGNVIYNRFEGTGAGHINITGGTQSGSETADEFPIGKYIVIKYRATDVQLSLTVGAKNESGSMKALGNYQIDIPGDKWRVAVVSLEDVTVFKDDADGNSTVYVMISTYPAAGATRYIVDIAYAAIVDSIDEAKLLLENGEGYVDYGKSFDSEGTLVEGESGS